MAVEQISVLAVKIREWISKGIQILRIVVIHIKFNFVPEHVYLHVLQEATLILRMCVSPAMKLVKLALDQTRRAVLLVLQVMFVLWISTFAFNNVQKVITRVSPYVPCTIDGDECQGICFISIEAK